MATDIAFAVGVLALLGRRVLPALRGCHSFLWISVAVLDQLRKLPEDIGNALPISHHRRLLGVKDDEVKLALATKAVEEDLTVNELEEEDGPPGGQAEPREEAAPRVRQGDPRAEADRRDGPGPRGPRGRRDRAPDRHPRRAAGGAASPARGAAEGARRAD